MKRLLLFGLALTLYISGCNSNGSPDSVKEAKTETSQKRDSLHHVERPGDTTVFTIPEQDAAFLINAASNGMLEIELGQLAQIHAGSQRVKAFGNRMIRDHSKDSEDLKSLADSKRVTFPNSISNDQQKKKEKLQKKSGPEFDKSYISLMIEDYKEDIREFKKAAENAKDPDIKAFANTRLFLLQQHLNSAESLWKHTKKM